MNSSSPTPSSTNPPAETSTQSAENKTIPFPLPLAHSLVLLSSALLLGFLGDWLFRADALGLNWSIYLGLFVVLSEVLAWRFEVARLNPALSGSLLLLALLFLWRASPFLQALNLAVTAFLLGLAVMRLSLPLLKETSFPELALNLVRALFSLPTRLLHFVTGNRWRDALPQGSNWQAARATLRGLAFALPLLIVFSLLLASADAAFESFLGGLVSFDLGALLGHLIFICFLTFVTLALLSQMLVGDAWRRLEVATPSAFRFGAIETGVVFGSLVLLFLSFFAVQFGYLFGGERAVSTTDLSYAEYGRRGFFELVAVTVLLHLVLLSGLWLVIEGRAFTLYRVLAAALVGLLFGVIWSAHSRLGLYIDVYGLTELRYYSSAMIFWIGVVMLFFLARLFLRRAPKVAPAYLALGVLGVVALYVSNPDARIAQVNLARAEQSTELDVGYLSQLSLDAAPVMVRSLEQLPSEERLEVAQNLHYRRNRSLPADPRSFNLGRWRGARALAF